MLNHPPSQAAAPPQGQEVHDPARFLPVEQPPPDYKNLPVIWGKVLLGPEYIQRDETKVPKDVIDLMDAIDTDDLMTPESFVKVASIDGHLGYFNNPACLLDPGFCIRKLADLDMTDVRWSGPVERGGLLALASDFMEAVVEPLRRHVFGHVFSAVVPGMVCVDAFPVVAPQSHVFARGDANHPLSNAHCDGDPVFMRDASERAAIYHAWHLERQKLDALHHDHAHQNGRPAPPLTFAGHTYSALVPGVASPFRKPWTFQMNLNVWKAFDHTAEHTFLGLAIRLGTGNRVFTPSNTRLCFHMGPPDDLLSTKSLQWLTCKQTTDTVIIFPSYNSFHADAYGTMHASIDPHDASTGRRLHEDKMLRYSCDGRLLVRWDYDKLPVLHGSWLPSLAPSGQRFYYDTKTHLWTWNHPSLTWPKGLQLNNVPPPGPVLGYHTGPTVYQFTSPHVPPGDLKIVKHEGKGS